MRWLHDRGKNLAYKRIRSSQISDNNGLSLAMHQNQESKIEKKTQRLEVPLQKIYQMKSGQVEFQLAGTALRKLNSFITSRIISSFSFYLLPTFLSSRAAFFAFCV